MATPSKRTALSSFTSSKPSNINDVLQKFYTIVENLKQNYENDVDILNKRIGELESENRRLRAVHEQHPHSIFDIDYVPNDSSTINHLQSELDISQKQIKALQEKLEEKCSEYEDMKTKYNLQYLMNENHSENQSSSTDLNKIKELELKLKQIKDQINQFDQCNYETDEQVRLLKQLITHNDQEQNKTITQSLTVKQSDLFQQTDIVENILNKQHEKIIEKIMDLFDKNPQYEQQINTKNKKNKKKRL